MGLRGVEMTNMRMGIRSAVKKVAAKLPRRGALLVDALLAEAGQFIAQKLNDNELKPAIRRCLLGHLGLRVNALEDGEYDTLVAECYEAIRKCRDARNEEKHAE